MWKSKKAKKFSGKIQINNYKQPQLHALSVLIWCLEIYENDPLNTSVHSIKVACPLLRNEAQNYEKWNKIFPIFSRFILFQIWIEKTNTPNLQNINSPVIRQKDESQNGCFKKTKHAKYTEKRTFLTPWYAA